MANFVLAYHGGATPDSTTEEERNAIMGEWEAWYGKLGPAIVDGGAPFGQSKRVATDGTVSDGGGSDPLTGYTIVAADDIDTVLSLVETHPHLKAGGTIEVAETIQM